MDGEASSLTPRLVLHLPFRLSPLTGRHLFTKALTGPLVKGRTVVLCTHHTSLVLPGVSYHVELEEGRIVSQGPVERSKVDESALEQVEEACNAEEEVPKEGAEAEEEERVKPSIAAETWTMGAVHRSIYVTYLSSAGWLLCAMHLLFVVARPVVGFAEQFWLRRWGESLSQVRVDYFLVGYGIISELPSTCYFSTALADAPLLFPSQVSPRSSSSSLPCWRSTLCRCGL